MPTWKAIHWSRIALAFVLPLCFAGAGHASIQNVPAAAFNENHIVASDVEFSSSSLAAFDDAKGRPDSSDELDLSKRLREPSKKYHPLSGSSSSSSSSSTATSGGTAMLAKGGFYLPERDDRVQWLGHEDSIVSFSKFVFRLLRPPRDC
jgi:hypothetical protein